MSEQRQPSLAERLADNTTVTDAISKAARAAVLSHARAGRPVATWQNGQVVWLEPAEVLARLAAEPTAEPNARDR
jgi:hypothetical protein